MKLILGLMALFLPSAFVLVSAEIGKEPISNDGFMLFLAPIVAFYILTILGIVLYVKYVPFNPLLLSAGFTLSPLSQYIDETMHPTYLPGMGSPAYFATIMYVRFYALPFFIASIIIAVIIFKRKKKANNGDNMKKGEEK